MAALVEASAARDASDRGAGTLYHHCADAHPRGTSDGIPTRELARLWLCDRAPLGAHPMARDPLLRSGQRGSRLSLRAKPTWPLGLDHAWLSAGDRALA